MRAARERGRGVLGRALVREAVANLFALPQRSALALLGVVIGVTAVVAMATIGRNAEHEAARRFDSMGADLMLVQQRPEPRATAGLTAGLIDDLPRRRPEITAAAPMAMGRADVSAGRRSFNAGLIAATPALAPLAGYSTVGGRFISEADGDHAFVVLGRNSARALSGPGRPATVGRRVRIGRYAFTVIGVLAPARPLATMPDQADNAVIIPLAAARRVMEPGVNAALVRMRRDVDDLAVADAVTRDLQGQVRGLHVQVQTARYLVEALRGQMAVQTRLLAAVGGVSLLVGGVGVMNVMLMRVLERRREIGLRSALGARPQDIFLMFLVEALTLSLAGGVTGSLLGTALAWAAAAAAHWRFAPAPEALPLGAGVAAIVGLVFGLYPALSAARLDPIVALRGE